MVTIEKYAMKTVSIKDLHTTLSVLQRLDCDVPGELLCNIAQSIREKEKTARVRKLNRMDEEQLIAFTNKRKTTLRVNLDDGSFIQHRTNDSTFEAALMTFGLDKLRNVTYKVRRHPIVILDESGRRKRIPSYQPLGQGLFFYRKTTAVEKVAFLAYLDELFCLNWIVELI